MGVTIEYGLVGFLVVFGFFTTNGHCQLTPSTGCKFNNGRCQYDINIKDCGTGGVNPASLAAVKDVTTNRNNIAQLEFKWDFTKSELSKLTEMIQKLQVIADVKEQHLNDQNLKIMGLERNVFQLQLEVDHVKQDSPYVKENVELKKEMELLRNNKKVLLNQLDLCKDKLNRSIAKNVELVSENEALRMFVAGNSSGSDICLRTVCNESRHLAKKQQQQLSQCSSESKTHEHQLQMKTVQTHALERQLLSSQNNNDVCERSLNYTTSEMLSAQQQLRSTSASLQYLRKEKTVADAEVKQCKASTEKFTVDAELCGNNTLKMANVITALKDSLAKCKKEPSTVPKTCEDWKNLGYTKKTDYMIDPDGAMGVDPFMVECEMPKVADQRAATIIHHKNEARMKPNVRGCTTAQCVSVKLTYLVSMPQIVALMNISTDCKQHIKYQCLRSPLLLSNKHAPPHGTWYSRDGEAMKYWGGAEPGSKKCACGMTETCVKQSETCNCDIDSTVWQTDEGYLHDKKTLPVGAVRVAGRQINYSDGYLQVGAMSCYVG